MNSPISLTILDKLGVDALLGSWSRVSMPVLYKLHIATLRTNCTIKLLGRLCVCVLLCFSVNLLNSGLEGRVVEADGCLYYEVVLVCYIWHHLLLKIIGSKEFERKEKRYGIIS